MPDIFVANYPELLEMYVYRYTVKTDAKTEGFKKGYVPFVLYGAQANVPVFVDWGDGTGVERLPWHETYQEIVEDDYTHEYGAPGEYTISVASFDFDKLYITANYSYELETNYAPTLISVDTALPKLNGVTYKTSSSSSHYNYVEDLRYCFSYCSSLTSIPQGLFDNNPAVTNFSYCFSQCSSLTSIPQGLFDNNPAVTNFSYCFSQCSLLTAIPQGLFDNNPAVTTFSACFWVCRKITEIPVGLFAKNTKVTDFHITFFKTGITSIPDGLIDNCPLVTDISGMFGMTKITSIPFGLFSNQELVTTLGNNVTQSSNGVFSNTDETLPNSAIDVDMFAHMLDLTEVSFAFVARAGFSIRFRATEIIKATAFCSKKTGQTTTVYVPAGSTTAATFHALESNLGLNVVEE